jgi:hypothetical protein
MAQVKRDLKCEASTLQLQDTIKGLLADKEVSNKKGGRKRREEEQIKNYSDVKKMKLDIDESNT